MFLRLFCGDHAGKAALCRRFFIENTAVWEGDLAPGVWILGSDVVGFFAKCIVLAQCVAGFCGVFCRNQVGFVLY